MDEEDQTDRRLNVERPFFRPLYLSGTAVFFLVAVLFVFWNFYLFSISDRTDGVIASVNVRQVGSKTPATIYEMWAGFQCANRQVYTRVGTSLFYQPYNKGDRIIVYYDPQKPEDAFINTLGTIWFFPMIFFLIGLVWLVLAKPSVDDLKAIRRKLAEKIIRT